MYDSARILDLLSARKPGHSLPQALYADPAVHEFDLSAIFGRSWLMIGFEVELAKPGSYIALTIGRSPIIVIRTREGDIRGFHNVCRHRGAQLCGDGHGRSAKLVCPYHQWTYDLDGKLLYADRMADGFDMSTHGLTPIRVELLAGCIYVSLADDAPDFAPFRAVAEPQLLKHNFKDAKVAFSSTLVEKANWKLVMENARECYHCAACHPELGLAFPTGMSKHFDFGEDQHAVNFEERMARVGLDTTPREGDWWQVARFMLNPGVESMSLDGKPCVNKRMIEVNEREIGSLRWAIEPHNFAHALPEYAFMFSAFPTGPQETVVLSKWLVHKDAVEGVDYTLDGLTETWTRTNLQDRDLAENNQRGVNSLGYRPGPYSEDAEGLVLRFVDWYGATAERHAKSVAA